MKLRNQNVSSRELMRLLAEATLQELIDMVSVGNQVHFDPVRVGDSVIECLQFTDMEAYIDQQVARPDSGQGADALPLWAKIWPASLPLAIYLRQLTPRKTDRVLEIGAGLGLAGMFAAKQGFRVVISDNTPEALLFARINVLRNNLSDLVQVLPVDFVKDGHKGSYSHIIGSEVLYREQFFEPLLRFLRNHLESGANSQILLTADAGRRTLKFFAAAKDYFQIARNAIPCRPNAVLSRDGSDAGLAVPPEQTIYLYRLRPL